MYSYQPNSNQFSCSRVDENEILYLYYIIKVVRLTTLIYRIRAIKPPLIQNLNKPPIFYPKSSLFGAFLVKFWKNFNKPPAQNLDFFIDRRRFIGADTVIRL